MKLSHQAALYSAMVFPGAGYFVVKEKPRGWIALTITLICLGVIIKDASFKAQIIAEKIVNGMMPFDVAIIRDQILHTPGFFSETVIWMVSSIIVVVWLVGLIDSFRIGKRLEKTEK